MYAVDLRLIGKPIVDFLLVIIELFSHGSGATSKYRLEIAVFEGHGSLGPNFQIEGDDPTNYLCTVR